MRRSRWPRSGPASRCTAKSRSRRQPGRAGRSSTPARRPVSGSAARRTRSSARASRPRARPSTTAASAPRSPPPRRWSRPAMSAGTSDPDFYYQPGGGPLLDMGPYYVTALVHLLGPVVATIGAASHTRSTRTIGGGPRKGEVIPVTTDSHVTGVLEHASGALSTLFMSFDAVATRSRWIEVHGERGSLIAPDPNLFRRRRRAAGARDERPGRPCRSTPATNAPRADTGSRIWPRRPTARSREPAAPSRSTCSTSWSPCCARPGRDGARSWSSTCERPAPVPLQALPGTDETIPGYH